MLSTIGTPISGRFCLAASALFLSVLAWPVAGSIGSLRPTMVPHSAPPQSATRTRDLPPSVSQVPVGSAASAPDAHATSPSAATAQPAIRMIVIVDPSLQNFRARRIERFQAKWKPVRGYI